MENQNRGGDDGGGDVTRPLGLRRRVRGGGGGESERLAAADTASNAPWTDGERGRERRAIPRTADAAAVAASDVPPPLFSSSSQSLADSLSHQEAT